MSLGVTVDRISFGYGKDSCVLRDVTFSVKAGSFLAIAGPNGAGKTTLLKLLCGELEAQSGTITLDDTPIGALTVDQRARRMAVVRQLSTPAFGYTVAETVMMARTLYLGSGGFESRQDRSIVREALRATDTEILANRALVSLSGGERQRVYIARALAQQTALLLLDEPTSSLDLRHQVSIHELLKTAQKERQRTIISITHDINLAARYCDAILLLGGTAGGQGPHDRRQPSVYFMGTPDQVLSEERLEQVFGIKIACGIVAGRRVFTPLGGSTSA